MQVGTKDKGYYYGLHQYLPFPEQMVSTGQSNSPETILLSPIERKCMAKSGMPIGRRDLQVD